MGSCWNCETQITLKDEEIHCDNCNELIRYWCHNCKIPFDIIDKKTKEKLNECSVCGFFVCPNCKICGERCAKNEWVLQIRKILEPEITNITINNLSEKLKKIISFIEDIKISKEQKNCFNFVPISYAKGRIKTCLAKAKGYRTKNSIDKQEFEKRFDKIIQLPVGQEFTVEELREDGNYGQEFRDMLNSAVCYGLIKIEVRLNKERKQYNLYKRIDGKKCEFLDVKDLFYMNCTKCKNKFPIGTERCNKCVHKKKTKHYDIGEYHKLKLKLTNKDVCQYPRSNFKTNKRVDGDTNV